MIIMMVVVVKVLIKLQRDYIAQNSLHTATFSPPNLAKKI